MPKQFVVAMLRQILPTGELTFPLGRWGRLGNQLFQIAGTYAIASDRHLGVCFRRDWPYLGMFNLPEQWFCSRLHALRSSTAVPYVRNTRLDLAVYFQDLSIWGGREDEIRNLLRPTRHTIGQALAREPGFSGTGTAAVHVRRGDYLAANALHKPLPLSYYRQAIAEIRQRDAASFAVFSDDPDWCREQLRVDGARYVSGNPDWVDLSLMTLCDYHICANSTFSWWGAFLSEDPMPTVPWMVGVLPEELRRIHPPHWREIEIT